MDHAALTSPDRLLEYLVGLPVQDADGRAVGRVLEVIGFDDTAEVIVQLAGLLGIKSKLVAMRRVDFVVSRDEAGNSTVTAKAPKETLMELPEHVAS